MLFGLLLDLYTGSLLGLHALLFVCFTYACQRFFYQFRVSPLWQQSVILFFLFFIFKMVFTFDFLNVTSGMNVSDLPYISSAILFALISSLCWPPTVYVLRELRRKKIATQSLYEEIYNFTHLDNINLSWSCFGSFYLTVAKGFLLIHFCQ